jgi:hypothetical protein
VLHRHPSRQRRAGRKCAFGRVTERERREVRDVQTRRIENRGDDSRPPVEHRPADEERERRGRAGAENVHHRKRKSEVPDDQIREPRQRAETDEARRMCGQRVKRTGRQAI